MYDRRDGVSRPGVVQWTENGEGWLVKVRAESPMAGVPRSCATLKPVDIQTFTTTPGTENCRPLHLGGDAALTVQR